MYTDRRLIGQARALRRDMTTGEKRLWYHLRRRAVEGHRFRRQAPIGSYVADFACLDARLVVEVDGDSHGNNAAEADDIPRDRELNRLGYRVLRFRNGYVMEETAIVVDMIREAIIEGLTPPPP